MRVVDAYIKTVEELVQCDLSLVPIQRNRLEAGGTVRELGAHEYLALVVFPQLESERRGIAGCNHIRIEDKLQRKEKIRRTETGKLGMCVCDLSDVEQRDEWFVADLLEREHQRVVLVRNAFQRRDD